MCVYVIQYYNELLTFNLKQTRKHRDRLTVLSRKVDNYNNKLSYRKEKLWKNRYISFVVI